MPVVGPSKASLKRQIRQRVEAVAEDKAMTQLAQDLLSSALRLRWEKGYLGDEKGIRVLAEKVPGFTLEQYAEAYARAKELDETAWRLAEEFHAKRRTSVDEAGELHKLFPGFAAQDYWDAWNQNLIWVAK
jgi:hypothetical protein